MIDTIDGTPDDKFVPYQRMAAVIVEITKEKGGCLPQDLLEKGFTQQQTIDQWHMANAMADIELKLINRTL